MPTLRPLDTVPEEEDTTLTYRPHRRHHTRRRLEERSEPFKPARRPHYSIPFSRDSNPTAPDTPRSGGWLGSLSRLPLVGSLFRGKNDGENTPTGASRTIENNENRGRSMNHRAHSTRRTAPSPSMITPNEPVDISDDDFFDPQSHPSCPGSGHEQDLNDPPPPNVPSGDIPRASFVPASSSRRGRFSVLTEADDEDVDSARKLCEVLQGPDYYSANSSSGDRRSDYIDSDRMVGGGRDAFQNITFERLSTIRPTSAGVGSCRLAETPKASNEDRQSHWRDSEHSYGLDRLSASIQVPESGRRKRTSDAMTGNSPLPPLKYHQNSASGRSDPALSWTPPEWLLKATDGGYGDSWRYPMRPISEPNRPSSFYADVFKSHKLNMLAGDNRELGLQRTRLLGPRKLTPAELKRQFIRTRLKPAGSCRWIDAEAYMEKEKAEQVANAYNQDTPFSAAVPNTMANSISFLQRQALASAPTLLAGRASMDREKTTLEDSNSCLSLPITGTGTRSNLGEPQPGKQVVTITRRPLFGKAAEEMTDKQPHPVATELQPSPPSPRLPPPSPASAPVPVSIPPVVTTVTQGITPTPSHLAVSAKMTPPASPKVSRTTPPLAVVEEPRKEIDEGKEKTDNNSRSPSLTRRSPSLPRAASTRSPTPPASPEPQIDATKTTLDASVAPSASGPVASAPQVSESPLAATPPPIETPKSPSPTAAAASTPSPPVVAPPTPPQPPQPPVAPVAAAPPPAAIPWWKANVGKPVQVAIEDDGFADDADRDDDKPTPAAVNGGAPKDPIASVFGSSSQPSNNDPLASVFASASSGTSSSTFSSLMGGSSSSPSSLFGQTEPPKSLVFPFAGSSSSSPNASSSSALPASSVSGLFGSTRGEGTGSANSTTTSTWLLGGQSTSGAVFGGKASGGNGGGLFGGGSERTSMTSEGLFGSSTGSQWPQSGSSGTLRRDGTSKGVETTGASAAYSSFLSIKAEVVSGQDTTKNLFGSFSSSQPDSGATFLPSTAASSSVISASPFASTSSNTSLFGGPSQLTSAPGASLFGGSTSKPTDPASIFASTTTSMTASGTSTGLFGNSSGGAGKETGELFKFGGTVGGSSTSEAGGASKTLPPLPSSQGAGEVGGLFGGASTGSTMGVGLFTNSSQSPAGGGGGGFGSASSGGTSLFGNPAPPSSGGSFAGVFGGGGTNHSCGSTGLFGGSSETIFGGGSGGGAGGAGTSGGAFGGGTSLSAPPFSMAQEGRTSPMQGAGGEGQASAPTRRKLKLIKKCITQPPP